MITFREYRNQAEAFFTAIDNMDDWLVLGIASQETCGRSYAPALMRHRDSDCLTESNWYVALKRLGGDTYDTVDETGDVRTVEFSHWAVGWVQHIMVRPNTPAHETAKKLEKDLENYPLLDENDLSKREDEEAQLVWKDCYNNADRIEYIRKYRYEFEFQSFADMLGCVRGNYFAGDAGELIYR